MIAFIYSNSHTCEMSYLRKNVAHLMAAGGHNPNSLADASHAKQPNIFRILEGQSEEPRDSTLKPLADYWMVTIQDLKYKDLTGAIEARLPLFAADIQARSEPSAEPPLDEFVKLMTLYRDATEEGRESIMMAATTAPKRKSVLAAKDKT